MIVQQASRLFGILILVLVPQDSRGEVDPDCRQGEYSFTCALNRVGDAKSADELFKPVLARYGWESACYTVQYIGGDNGEPDSLVLVINGPPGAKAPECGVPSEANKAKSANKSLLKKIGLELRKALNGAPKPLRDRLLRNTNELSLANGYDAEVELSLPK